MKKTSIDRLKEALDIAPYNSNFQSIGYKCKPAEGFGKLFGPCGEVTYRWDVSINSEDVKYVLEENEELKARIKELELSWTEENARKTDAYIERTKLKKQNEYLLECIQHMVNIPDNKYTTLMDIKEFAERVMEKIKNEK